MLAGAGAVCQHVLLYVIHEIDFSQGRGPSMYFILTCGQVVGLFRRTFVFDR